MLNYKLSDVHSFLVSLVGTVLLTTLCVTAAVGPARAAVFTPVMF